MKTLVDIINIGDELLIGQVVNTNASWMGKILSKNGFTVREIKAISDDESAINEALNLSIPNAHIVLLSGGLGPTKDDITKKVLTKYFETELQFNEEAFEHIQDLFKSRGFKITGVNKDQANLPKNATAILNRNGTASGMWFEKNGVVVVSMPGVPFEMKTMMEKDIVPRLKEKYKPAQYVQKTIMTTGMGESFLAQKIEEQENQLPNHIKLAYLPRPGLVRLRLSGRGNDQVKLQKEIDQHTHAIVEQIEDWVFGYDDISLEESTAQILVQQNKTIAAAESCTGGNIAHLFTSIPGSSQYFMGGIVSYSNASKIKVLGVRPESIEEFGAVSENVVRQMAEGARKALKVDYAIATSGIAGPDGGSDEKPVGTTWIAVSGPQQTKSQLFQFGEHRGRNITRASLAAIQMLRSMVLEDTQE